MCLALLQVNMSSATDLLSVHAIMQLWCRPVATWLVPFSAEAVHLQAGQGTFKIHQ